MPKPKFSRNVAWSALLLGLIFVATNVYLDASGYRKLANLSFGLAVLSEMVFVVFIILWLVVKTWLTEPARPPAPPQGIAPQKKPQPPQQPQP